MIYLDNASTTRPSESAKKAVLEAMECFGNPSSMHRMGLAAGKRASKKAGSKWQRHWAPSFALSRIPAFVLTSPWAGRQATLSEFVPQTAAGAFFRLRGGCTASPILQAEQMAEAALDACRIQNGRCKTGGISDEVLQPRR